MGRSPWTSVDTSTGTRTIGRSTRRPRGGFPGPPNGPQLRSGRPRGGPNRPTSSNPRGGGSNFSERRSASSQTRSGSPRPARLRRVRRVRPAHESAPSHPVRTRGTVDCATRNRPSRSRRPPRPLLSPQDLEGGAHDPRPRKRRPAEPREIARIGPPPPRRSLPRAEGLPRPSSPSRVDDGSRGRRSTYPPRGSVSSHLESSPG